ncbi:MAG: proton-conducting transporter membrane subunit [Candidatus Eisenbacteria bacterium]
MSLLALLLAPIGGALLASLDPSRPRRQIWLLLAAGAHMGLLGLAWLGRLTDSPLLWLSFDPLGGMVLSLVSLVFMAVSIYGIGYFRREPPRGGRLFETCMLGFLTSASVVCLTDHFGVMWVAMEATTLATAPLIYDSHDRHSIEAVWKYLLICSVGIAMALLGTFMLALAQGASLAAPSLSRSVLLRTPGLHPVWFRAAFAFLFIGYGTKVGLVPMHSWLPDAHGEAPSPISALLSGALLNCAFLAILRVVQVAHAVDQQRIVGPVLIGFGLASMLVAGALMLRQRNYKRMLAFSSIEHMGVLAVGCGLGRAATYGALLHMLGSGLCKALLFFVAGNMLIEYRSKRIADVSGLLRRLPVSGTLLILGFSALSGVPPSAPFLSQLTILRGAVQVGQPWVAVAFMVLQVIVFVGMAAQIVSMAQGGSGPAARQVESRWLLLPPAGLLAIVVGLGLYLPTALQRVLATAAATLGGTAP